MTGALQTGIPASGSSAGNEHPDGFRGHDLGGPGHPKALSSGPCQHQTAPTTTKPAWQRVLLLAGGLGFEPRLVESESTVLPLDDPPSESAQVNQTQAQIQMGARCIPCACICLLLTLGELRSTAGLVQTDLLALDLARIAGHESGTTQG